jgi:hypothetical protein
MPRRDTGGAASTALKQMALLPTWPQCRSNLLRRKIQQRVLLWLHQTGLPRVQVGKPADLTQVIVMTDKVALVVPPHIPQRDHR